MRKLFLSLAAFVLLVPMIGLAADMRTSELVAKDETPKNLYLAGQNPTVDANVTGDLVVAGSTVTVNGDVTGGVFAAGSTLNLNGKVANSLRVAGGNVNMESTVGGDVIVFGGNVILGTKSVVTGDVIVFGGTVDLKGKVLGSVKNTYAGDVTIVGSVAGDVQLSKVSTVHVSDTAVIIGKLVYSSQNEAVVASAAKVGGVEYTKIAATNTNTESMGSRFGTVLVGIILAFVTLLVFINLFPKFAKETVSEALVNPWAKMGVGFLAIVVTPIALLVLLFTFFGWGIMGYLFMAYGAFFAVTGTLTALFAGSLAWKYIKKEKELTVNWKTAGIGILLVGLMKPVPIVGWLVAAVLALVIFGTLTTKSFQYIKAQRA
jgi:cytoskeletal protein CcmA (bactofilin family)